MAAWRARLVAETTIHTTPALTREAAGFVDAQVAAVAGRIGPEQLDRLVAESIRRYDLAVADPTTDPEDGYLHLDPRHVTVHDDDVHFAGTMRIEAEVDLGLDAHGAGEVDVVVVHGHVPRIEVEVTVLRIRGRVGDREVVAPDRLGDEAVELLGSDPSGDGGDLRVDEPRRLARECRGGVDGGLRDQAGPPRRHPARCLLYTSPSPRDS